MIKFFLILVLGLPPHAGIVLDEAWSWQACRNLMVKWQHMQEEFQEYQPTLVCIGDMHYETTRP
jgi:hypothetical protein